VYRFKNGKGLKISITFVDDGGHFTQEVRLNCAKRIGMRIFDCKGFAGDGRPFTAPPKKVRVMADGRHVCDCWQYQLGVDAGKQMIMDGLKIQTPGPRYCHFPSEEDKGYGHKFFVGLLSEHLVYKKGNKNPWQWEIIPGHERNEPLDCRNYALAAFRALSPDMDALLRRQNGTENTRKLAEQQKPKRKPARRTVEERATDYYDW
jgi:phage terminase large subunit GpA-like protein